MDVSQSYQLASLAIPNDILKQDRPLLEPERGQRPCQTKSLVSQTCSCYNTKVVALAVRHERAWPSQRRSRIERKALSNNDLRPSSGVSLALWVIQAWRRLGRLSRYRAKRLTPDPRSSTLLPSDGLSHWSRGGSNSRHSGLAADGAERIPLEFPGLSAAPTALPSVGMGLGAFPRGNAPNPASLVRRLVQSPDRPTR